MDLSHIDENRLNEYLDGVLNPDQCAEIEAHLGQCSLCQAQLEELNAVFAVFQDLAEISLDRDLTPAIMERIQPPSLAWYAGRWLIGFQISLAIILLAFTWPHFRARLTELPFDQYSLQSEAFLLEITQTISQIRVDAVVTVNQWIRWGTEWTQPSAFSPYLGLNLWPWIVVLGLAWLISNGLFLWPTWRKRGSRPG